MGAGVLCLGINSEGAGSLISSDPKTICVLFGLIFFLSIMHNFKVPARRSKTMPMDRMLDFMIFFYDF